MLSRALPELRAVLAKHPRLCAQFRFDEGQTGFDALKQGLVDFVILPKDRVTAEFDSKRLRPEKYFLYAPIQWKSRSLVDVVELERIVDFETSDRITKDLLKVYGLENRARVDRHYANNSNALAYLVGAAFGYSALSEEFAEPFVAEKKIFKLCNKLHLKVEFALAWYPRNHMNAELKDLIAALK